MSSPALVSVVIPTYNRADSVCAAVESALVQKWEPLEVVVVDDASTDDSFARLSLMAGHDPRIRVHRRAVNGGEATARNDGIRAARGEFIAFLDSDNKFWPEKLVKQMRPLIQSKGHSLSFTGYRLVAPGRTEDVVLDSWSEAPVSALDRLLRGCCVNVSTVVAPRSLLLGSGLCDASLSLCVDHDLWLRLAVLGASFIYEKTVLTDYRFDSSSISANQRLLARCSEMVVERVLRRQDLPEPIARNRAGYRAHWALSSAGRYLDAGDGRAALDALGRAAKARPMAVRPGWLRLAAAALLQIARSS